MTTPTLQNERPLPSVLTEGEPIFLPDGRINPEWTAKYGPLEEDTARVAEEPPAPEPSRDEDSAH